MATRINHSTITTILTVTDAKAATEFYERAFGFENAYVPGGGNWVQQCPPPLQLNESTILLVQAKFATGPNLAVGMLPVPANNAKALGILPISLYIRVPDVDKVVAEAVRLGATSLGPIKEMLWGARCGTVIDPDGYTWMVATQVRVPTKKEMTHKFKELLEAERST